MESSLLAANTGFAFKLFATLAERERDHNLFVSPASIALALGLAANGARGATWRAIADALQLGEIDLAALNQANADLMRVFGQADPQVTLAVASSLWARQGVVLSPAFVERCRAVYAAEVAALDFAAPQSIATINAWVARQTNGKIERIVDRIARDAVLYLLNAVYFKGLWARPFDPRLTTVGSFTPPSGPARPHPLMSQHGKYRYLETRDFQAISLPYGGGRIVMDVFLPAQSSSLAAFCARLSSADWGHWQSRFAEVEGLIQLPRFRLAYEAPLNEPLRALGMGVAFGSSADFGGMCESTERVQIDEVRHKTFVEVNEAGTEAAAATSVGMLRATFMPKQTFRMIVDRPFFCAIRDTRTGLLLFMGAIADPAAGA
jgi:serpin B